MFADTELFLSDNGLNHHFVASKAEPMIGNTALLAMLNTQNLY